MSDSLIGTLLCNRYRFIRHIGKGNLTDVYLAYDEHYKNTNVAVKIIESKKISTDKLNKIYNNVNEPKDINNKFNNSHNIAYIYDVAHENKQTYIVMEYFEGNSLKNWFLNKNIDFTKENIEESNQLPVIEEDDISNITNQLLKAINYLHRRNVIITSINPNCIFLRKENSIEEVVLTDFGLYDCFRKFELKKMDADKDQINTGKIQYMAPELITENNYTKNSDLWSLGALVFWLKSNGQHPYYNEKNYEKLSDETFNKKQYVKDTLNMYPNYDLIKGSNLLKTFLNEVILPNAEERVHVNDLLNHPWITKEPGFIKFTQQEMREAYFAKSQIKSFFKTLPFFSRILEADKNIRKKTQLQEERKKVQINLARVNSRKKTFEKQNEDQSAGDPDKEKNQENIMFDEKSILAKTKSRLKINRRKQKTQHLKDKILKQFVYGKSMNVTEQTSQLELIQKKSEEEDIELNKDINEDIKGSKRTIKYSDVAVQNIELSEKFEPSRRNSTLHPKASFTNKMDQVLSKLKNKKEPGMTQKKHFHNSPRHLKNILSPTNQNTGDNTSRSRTSLYHDANRQNLDSDGKNIEINAKKFLSKFHSLHGSVRDIPESGSYSPNRRGDSTNTNKNQEESENMNGLGINMPNKSDRNIRHNRNKSGLVYKNRLMPNKIFHISKLNEIKNSNEIERKQLKLHTLKTEEWSNSDEDEFEEVNKFTNKKTSIFYPGKNHSQKESLVSRLDMYEKLDDQKSYDDIDATPRDSVPHSMRECGSIKRESLFAKRDSQFAKKVKSKHREYLTGNLSPTEALPLELDLTLKDKESFNKTNDDIIPQPSIRDIMSQYNEEMDKKEEDAKNLQYITAKMCVGIAAEDKINRHYSIKTSNAIKSTGIVPEKTEIKNELSNANPLKQGDNLKNPDSHLINLSFKSPNKNPSISGNISCTLSPTSKTLLKINTEASQKYIDNLSNQNSGNKKDISFENQAVKSNLKSKKSDENNLNENNSITNYYKTDFFYSPNNSKSKLLKTYDIPNDIAKENKELLKKSSKEYYQEVNSNLTNRSNTLQDTIVVKNSNYEASFRDENTLKPKNLQFQKLNNNYLELNNDIDDLCKMYTQYETLAHSKGMLEKVKKPPQNTGLLVKKNVFEFSQRNEKFIRTYDSASKNLEKDFLIDFDYRCKKNKLNAKQKYLGRKMRQSVVSREKLNNNIQKFNDSLSKRLNSREQRNQSNSVIYETFDQTRLQTTTRLQTATKLQSNRSSDKFTTKQTPKNYPVNSEILKVFKLERHQQIEDTQRTIDIIGDNSDSRFDTNSFYPQNLHSNMNLSNAFVNNKTEVSNCNVIDKHKIIHQNFESKDLSFGKSIIDQKIKKSCSNSNKNSKDDNRFLLTNYSFSGLKRETPVYKMPQKHQFLLSSRKNEEKKLLSQRSTDNYKTNLSIKNYNDSAQYSKPTSFNYFSFRNKGNVDTDRRPKTFRPGVRELF